MNNVMVDIETLSTKSDAVILSIGAVKFGASGIVSEFYQQINIQSCIDLGMRVDGDTLAWWASQNKYAKKAFSGGLDIKDALLEFANWAGEDIILWGNGADFDNSILSTAYAKSEIEQPWKFWNNRCYRTVKSLFNDIVFERKGVHHNALDDAKSQALHLIKIMGAQLC